MAADSGLINLQRQLSLQEAKANVPSLTPLYTSTTSMAKKGLDMVSGAIAELKQEQGVLEAGKKRQTEALQTDANGVFKSIYELKETLPNKIVMAIKKDTPFDYVGYRCSDLDYFADDILEWRDNLKKGRSISLKELDNIKLIYRK